MFVGAIALGWCAGFVSQIAESGAQVVAFALFATGCALTVCGLAEVFQ